ncbi:zinc-binding dehydrogenase [Streptomyces panaciradicis]|uniref:zinc-binding dehydrogenase n=1 Tax=Streptomyces panaciradicis TaxID=1470261 RepID=UPI0027E52D23|nr:zinc-binding dehydrogenase [Streptomyces panaciradicis]
MQTAVRQLVRSGRLRRMTNAPYRLCPLPCPLGYRTTLVQPSSRASKRSSAAGASYRLSSWETAAAELGRQGRYTPRIEQTYPLERIVDAHAHAERGRTRGKIVICQQD